jgi:hypothetical protein
VVVELTGFRHVSKLSGLLQTFYVLLIQKLRLELSNVVRGHNASAELSCEHGTFGHAGMVRFGDRVYGSFFPLIDRRSRQDAKQASVSPPGSTLRDRFSKRVTPA